MENILVQFILPILTAIISYMAAVNKSKKELDAVKEENRGRIEQIETQSRADIEKLEKELDKKAEYNEKNLQNEKVGKLFDQMLEGDLSGLERITRMEEIINSGTHKNANHPAKKRK